MAGSFTQSEYTKGGKREGSLARLGRQREAHTGQRCPTVGPSAHGASRPPVRGTRHTRLAMQAPRAKEGTMRGQRLITSLLAGTLMLGLVASLPLVTAAAPARQDTLQIAFSVPGLQFPFFVHMM